MLATQIRPSSFKDMIGQEMVRKSLINQAKSGNFFSTYIFSGMHGCGKTTTARILAKAVNCENLAADGEPCGCCKSCRAVADGDGIDVIEIDGASNNGVDQARELIDNVQFPPVMLKKKVYIIDEVHMLSKGAFNALLKTLEEPPQWATFILATTEPEKIPDTVKSRAACYSFKAINSDELKEHLKKIAGQQGRSLEEGAYDVIIKHSGGSVRDAIRDLETCFSADGTLDAETAGNMLGVASGESARRLVKALTDNDAVTIADIVRDWFAAGRQIKTCMEQVLDELTQTILKTCLDGSEKALDTEYYLLEELLKIRNDMPCPIVTAELLRMAANSDRFARLEARIAALEEPEGFGI